MSGQLKLASPHCRVEAAEDVGALPVHGGSGPRWGGSCGIEVGNQPRWIDGDQVERILKKPIEPVGGSGVLGRVFAQVAVLPADVRGLAQEHVEQGAFVVGLVPRGEQLVDEGLVEQPGDRTGRALGGRGLQQVVSGRRTAQGIKIGDSGVVAEGGGESEPSGVVQPGAAGVGERREQLTVAFYPLVWKPVQVFAQRLPDPGRNPGRIEPLRGRVDYRTVGGERNGGHRGDQEVPPGPLRDHGSQPVTYPAPGAVLGPGGAGRPGVVHPVLGEQCGGELAQSVEVEVGVAVQVDDIVILEGGHAQGSQQPARGQGVARGQRPGGHGDPRPGQHRQLGQRLGDLPPVTVAGRLIQGIQDHGDRGLPGQVGEAGDQLIGRGRRVYAGQVGQRGEEVADGSGAGMEG